MNRPIVLILASDPAFSREITANWPMVQDHEPASRGEGPEFTVLDPSFSRDLEGSHYDLAIADASSEETKFTETKRGETKKAKSKLVHQRQIEAPKKDDLRPALASAGRPAIIIHSDPGRGFCNIHGAVIELRREPGIWPAFAGLIGREILRRRHAESRAAEAEKICAAAQAEATLGRYMVEMRTNVNNALTTVLGNAELLVHEPGLHSTVRSQADAIRNRALRLHEVFQRFSSLEKELTVAARDPAMKAATGR
jgi:hypothetical protein